MKLAKYIRQLIVTKIVNTRILAILVIQLFILRIYTKPVLAFSHSVQYRVSPWIFPFVISNIYFAFLFLLEIVYYFSNVPFMHYSNMYQVIRVGRKKWVIGQIVAIVIQSIFIMGINYFFSILCIGIYCEWTTGWGKLLHTAALTNASDYYEFLFDVSYDTMQKFSAIKLSVYTFLIGSLVICFIGIFMFMISLIINKTVAVVGAGIMVTGIYLVENVHPMLSQKLSMFIPTSWIRCANIGIKVHDSYVLPSMKYIICSLIVSIVTMCIVLVYRIRKIEFEWTREDEF